MTDSPDPIPFDNSPAEPDSFTFSLTREQKYALIALGGLSLVAVMLMAALARRQRRHDDLVGLVSLPESGPAPTADVVASIRHLAAAVDSRLQGFQQQLDAINQRLDMDGPAVRPSETVPFNGQGPANQTYEGVVADQPENVAPGTAGYSM